MPRRGRGQPPQAASGQTYGERQQRERAQEVQPVPDDQQRFARALQAAQQMESGDGGALRRPSERPDEPITAGLGIGAGPGPEAVPGVETPTRDRDPSVVHFASHLPMLEMLASRPGSSTTMRNLVRRLRSMVPADFDFSETMTQPATDDDVGAALAGGLDPDEVA